MNIEKRIRDKGKLVEIWEDAIEGMEHNVLDVEKTKNLLYNAYLYFAADSSELDVILRYDLPVYRRISRFCVINEYLVNQFGLKFLKGYEVFSRGEKNRRMERWQRDPHGRLRTGR